MTSTNSEQQADTAEQHNRPAETEASNQSRENNETETRQKQSNSKIGV